MYLILDENINNYHEGYDEAEFKDENKNKRPPEFDIIQNPYYDDGVENNLSGIYDSRKYEKKENTENIVVLQNPYYE